MDEPTIVTDEAARRVEVETTPNERDIHYIMGCKSAPMTVTRILAPGELERLASLASPPDEWHGCLTGDCPHTKQTDCDAALALYRAEKIIAELEANAAHLHSISSESGEADTQLAAARLIRSLLSRSEAAETAAFVALGKAEKAKRDYSAALAEDPSQWEPRHFDEFTALCVDATTAWLAVNRLVPASAEKGGSNG